MGSKTRDKLQPLQIQRWCRAVESGIAPTDKDPETGAVTELRLPMAKADGDGLTFTLSSKGTASWVLRYRRGGRAKELTLGNYPDIGLADARKLAREKRAEIDRGGDPAADKRKAVQAVYRDWTVRELIEDYERLVLVGLGTSTQRSYGRNLNRIKARIGGHLVSEVVSLDIVTTIESVGTTWTESNMLLVAAKMLFRHAVGKKLIVANPCIGIELNALIGKRPPIRKRLMLSGSELHFVMNAHMRPENLLAVKVLLGTAVRSDELFSAEKTQFDLVAGVWSIPSSKTGPGTQVPLTALVQRWIGELMILSGDSRYLLPTRIGARRDRAGGDAQINPNTIGAAIDYWLANAQPKVNVRRFTPHDLRSTAKSQMRALGIPSDITEMCLNHKLPGVEGIYDVHTYFEERKDALSKWADFLEKVSVKPDASAASWSFEGK
jgi:integrase